MTTAVGIIDYGMGNLRSLRNAVDHLGVDVAIVERPAELPDVERVILPGVGAFGRAMANLRSAGWLPALRAHVDSGRPLLGICLGMQLLAERSFEFGDHEGLGLLPGEVVPLEPSDAFPVPHVGWNTVELVGRHPFVERVKKSVDYYFVHSFHFRARTPEHVIGTTSYGIDFSSIVARGNVVGCQFHPEKSQAGGLALLERFAEWDGALPS